MQRERKAAFLGALKTKSLKEPYDAGTFLKKSFWKALLTRTHYSYPTFVVSSVVHTLEMIFYHLLLLAMRLKDLQTQNIFKILLEYCKNSIKARGEGLIEFRALQKGV